MTVLRDVGAIARREWAMAFATPAASVFLAAFVCLAMVLAFEVGGLFETGRADLLPLFQFFPWLFAGFVPALAMASWAGERQAGSMELLLSLPVATPALVVGKFLALWTLGVIGLVLTMPLWLLVSVLGPVDQGATLIGYLGATMMLGPFIALSMAASALAGSQIVAFVIAAGTCIAITVVGLPGVSAMLGPALGGALAGLSVLDQVSLIQRGALPLTAVTYFIGLSVALLSINGLIISAERAGS